MTLGMLSWVTGETQEPQGGGVWGGCGARWPRDQSEPPALSVVQEDF